MTHYAHAEASKDATANLNLNDEVRMTNEPDRDQMTRIVSLASAARAERRALPTAALPGYIISLNTAVAGKSARGLAHSKTLARLSGANSKSSGIGRPLKPQAGTKSNHQTTNHNPTQ